MAHARAAPRLRVRNAFTRDPLYSDDDSAYKTLRAARTAGSPSRTGFADASLYGGSSSSASLLARTRFGETNA
jgi:hypothetical protein